MWYRVKVVLCDMVKGVRCGRVYFTPRLYSTGGQGRVVGWDSVSGSPVRWGVWSIPSPIIFGSGVVRCGPVRCFEPESGTQCHSAGS